MASWCGPARRCPGDPPAGNETQDRYLTPVTGEEEDPGRTMLGSAQLGSLGAQAQNYEGFFLPRMVRSNLTWKVWGNEVTFMQFKVANNFVDALFPDEPNFPPVGPAENGEGIYVTLDQWDGFQAERLAITEAFREVTNFVTITGDIHSYIAGYIKPDYDEPAATPGNGPVGVELVCGSVTSSNLTELGSFGRGRALTSDGNEFTSATIASNPHIKYFNSDNHGYNLVRLSKTALVCSMVGLVSNDPNEPNPIRVANDSLVQKDLVQEFVAPAVGTTFQRIPVGGPQLYSSEVSGGPYAPLPPDPAT